jgi:predicted transcriptional regulator
MNELKCMTDKQMAMDALNQLPETASFQEIKEELEIVDGLKRGLDASEAGQVKTSEEVKEMVGSWFTK